MRCEGSIVALVTPFDADGSMDMRALRMLIERQIEAGTQAIVICGSTGETPTLTDDEQHEVLEESVRIAEGRIPIIAGTGCYSTAETVAKTRQAKELGAAACLVVFPYYNRPTPAGVRKHFEVLAKVGMPLILYHHPGRTGLRLPAADLIDLLAMDEMIAIKDCSAEIDLFLELIHSSDKPVLTGDDLHTIPFMAAGGKGVISVIANVIPKEWKEMADFCLQGDFVSARKLFYRFYPLCKTMTLDPNPQCIKFALSLMGLCRSDLRLPLFGPRESAQEEIRNAMQPLLAQSSLLVTG